MWKWLGKKSKRTQKPKLNRRDLLQGRLWKLMGQSAKKPLVMRYPTSRQDVDSVQAGSATGTTPSIHGIAIKPVQPTEFVQPLELVQPTGPAGQVAQPSIPLFRPPGAVEETQFLAGCTRCSDCADACPHDAIVKAPERFGAVAGTPVIEADTQACWMCEDFPCITACEPGVLTSKLPKTIGTAKITEHLCLAHHSTTCTVCSERCPVDDAIHVSDGKPTINEAACTGCGVCRYVCPAPENAVLLMPLFNRPSLPQ